MTRPRGQIVVMGVSGCGKSTTGAALAQALGWPFIEGDGFHPPGNLAKMAAGVALEDADRAPWLRALAQELARRDGLGQGVVLGCSALKRAYRDILRGGAPRLGFLHLHGSQGLLEQRLAQRAGHFFPPRLLQSQLAALEMLAPDEDGTVIDLGLPVAGQVAQALRWLGVDAQPPLPRWDCFSPQES